MQCEWGLDFAGIIDQADEKLFQLVLTNPNHVLFSLFADKTDQHYSEQHATTDNLLTKLSLFSNGFYRAAECRRGLAMRILFVSSSLRLSLCQTRGL